MMGTDIFFWIGIGIADPILFPIPIIHSLSDPLPIPIPIHTCVSDPDPDPDRIANPGSPINDRDPAHH